MAEQNVLEMSGITKVFPGVKALSGVNFSVRKGEIHALMGENGAGKSTLIKIMTGMYSCDEGKILFAGKPVHFASVSDAHRAGISPIYQEISLIPHLSVAENIFLGREIKAGRLIQVSKQVQKANEMVRGLGLSIDVTRSVKEYSVAIQQMVTIVRALSLEAKLVIMDEPTSSLTESEVEILFDVMRRLKSQGISIVFITHRLSEMFMICDRATVLKDGELVGTYPVSELTTIELVSKMIGRQAKQLARTRDVGAVNGPILLQAQGLKSLPRVLWADLEIRAGEIVGLAGLLGSGRSELAQALFGAASVDGGGLFLNGQKVSFANPIQAIGAGIAFLPENRKVDGIFPHLNVCENICVANRKRFSKFGVLSAKSQAETSNDYIRKLQIKTPSLEQELANLSGGNQQKTLLARWLCMNPKVMILDEPTRGIDVGAKAEIEALIAELAQSGMGVLYISSELEELVRNCDRVVVLREGKTAGCLVGEEISESNIMQVIAGGASNEESD